MARNHHNPQPIPFGWNNQDQRMVTVNDSKNGLACDCVCIACGAALMAKQGNKRAWHFAHADETLCKSAAEAAIHQMAKQLVAQHGRLFLPHKRLERKIHGEFMVWSETIRTLVQPRGVFKLEDCQVEKTIMGGDANDRTFRPDVVANLNGSPIAIEIFNTHAVDSAKATALKAQGISVLEIHVHDILQNEPKDMFAALEKRLLEPSDHVEWLVHAGDAEALSRLDVKESRVREKWKLKEAQLIQGYLSLQRKAERKRAYRDKFKEVSYSTIPVPGGVVSISRNTFKVSLKGFGHLPERLFREICSTGRDLGGKFNDKYRKWEFFKSEDQAEFLTQLQTRINHAVGHHGSGNFLLPSPFKATETAETANTAGTQIFPDQVRQEDYEERAAILQFESGLTRTEAEQIAFTWVNKKYNG